MAKKFFLQASCKQLNANGNEFLTQRNNYGNITYFTSTQIDQKDYLISVGMLYKFRDNVYANLHYNWWGMKFTRQDHKTSWTKNDIFRLCHYSSSC